VGEAMAIGRTFPESLQKALRSLELGRWGLNCDPGEAIYDELEQGWADVIGANGVERVRRDLTKVLAVDGALPPVRPTW